MERYLPDSVQYCSLARVHKITKYFNMVEASQKGFVTHVVICNRITRPILLSHKASTCGVPEVRKIFAKSVR
jgi:hypothetical protein